MGLDQMSLVTSLPVFCDLSGRQNEGTFLFDLGTSHVQAGNPNSDLLTFNDIEVLGHCGITSSPQT